MQSALLKYGHQVDLQATKGHGTHRNSGSSSGEAILAAFIPTFVTACIYLAIFVGIRSQYRKHYAPRTFLGTVPEKDRTPSSSRTHASWFQDFRVLHDRFLLQHSSLDAYLWLRFLRFIIFVCFVGCCFTFPILIPVNATGGGTASQLDKISFSNIANNDRLWAHVVVAWAFFGAVLALIVRERLQLIGIRQAYLLDETNASRLSSKVVLFMSAPREALQTENLHRFFGEGAVKAWPVPHTAELDDLVSRRNDTAYRLESAEFELIIKANKRQNKTPDAANGTQAQHNDEPLVPNQQRPAQRSPPVIGKKTDAITTSRKNVANLTDRIEKARGTQGDRTMPEQSAIFVAFSDQATAYRAYETVTFKSQLPMQMRYLGPKPKEVLWQNLVMLPTVRVSKASLALVFVIVFIIFFSIPVGIIGTISNIQYLEDKFEWLRFLDNLPDFVLGLITGLLPPFLVSWFVSYVPKLFRHIAQLSGEPTTPQAELKVQAWYFVFQVTQVFLITTFSSGGAAVAAQIIKDPTSAPDLLAESLPKASNFYLTYFILQGTASAASNILNYSDLLEYLFYQKYVNKTPRDQFNEYAKMKGISWGAVYPKFTNFLVIAIAYSCVAPLTLGFATVGISLYYLSYRYNLLYVVQAKIDTRGEAYKRALQQMTTGVYLAELCLIGLFGARKAFIQFALMIILLVITAVTNLIVDRMLLPLELYLGVDTWQEQEVPLLAEEEGLAQEDEEGLHAASHIRRLGLSRLPNSASYALSNFFETIISASRSHVKSWLHEPSVRDHDQAPPLEDEEMEKAYLSPSMTSKTPTLWLPSDGAGVSKEEIEDNRAAAIPSTDEGAEIDGKGNLQWEKDFEKVPIFKKPNASI